MDKLNFGDIVLLKFPYTDGNIYKKRPALIVNDYPDGDIIVCRISSKIYTTKNDIFIDAWKKAGLKLPSVIRVHKLATLERNMVQLVLGKIDNAIKEKIKIIISELTI